MPEMVSGDSANDVWQEAWSRVSSAPTVRDGGTTRSSRELLQTLITIRDPRQRWTTVRAPAINPAFALVEVVWILRGRRDAGFVTPWNPALSNFVGDAPELHGAYGERLRTRFGFDQLRRAAEALAQEPTQRQVVLQIWDPATDLPMADGRPRAADIPCNVCAMLKVSGGQLHWTQIMRSNDLVLGLPYNIVQWTTLQEIVAGWLGLGLGTYSHFSDSLHIYDRDSSCTPTGPLKPSVSPLTDLRLPLAESEATFAELERFLVQLVTLDSAAAVATLVRSINVPPGYDDWAVVCASEWLRRLNLPNDAQLTAQAIGDGTLAAALANWFHRNGRKR